MSFLELRNVSKAYGTGPAEVHALENIDVSVDRGALVAVMGPSGSGKSTLLTIAGSLEEPTSGEVTIGGAALTAMSRNDKARLRRRTIGYVFQDFNLLPGLTAAENVCLPLELDGMRARKAHAAGMAVLEELGIADRSTHYPDELSGGERQRVSILACTLAAQIAALQHRFGRVDVVENQTIAIPGSINTYDLRAQNPRGPFGQPMLSLVSGHYPTNAGQVAVTAGVAAAFGLKTGDVWQQAGQARRVVGIVENPQSLLDEFALVVPGQVRAPTQVTVLFDAPGVNPASLAPNVQSVSSASSGNPFNPKTIVLALATVAMLLIALVGVGGFTVLAQRRLRSLGMLGALGATDRHIRLVVRANGVVVGVAGALIGAALGLAAWFAYRPTVESNAHHVIGAFQLPWAVIAAAMALAVVATFFAASRPARSITKVPIVTALSGRPAPPKQVHRSAVPGVILLVVAAVLFWYTGKSTGGGGLPELVFGFVALIAAVVLLAPLFLATLARLGRRAKIAVRLALRDLARYRARSGSAVAAISLGVLIAVLVCVLSAQRYGNVLDYAGPNLASDQLVVYTPNAPQGGGPGNGPSGPVTGRTLRSMAASARGIAAALGSHEIIELDSTSASLQHAAAGRSWSGPIYLATPSLLRAFGIKTSQINPAADILTMRPGLSGLSKMQLIYGNHLGAPQYVGGPGGGPGNGPGGGGPGSNSQRTYPCPKSTCVANPVIQEVSALPSGTSAPNTVITEHATTASSEAPRRSPTYPGSPASSPASSAGSW